MIVIMLMIWKHFYMIGVKLHFKRKRSLAAFSLIEVLVATALFSVIILSSTQIFKMSIDSQRNSLATQNVQDSLKYFLEVIGKEMRTAKKNEGACPGIPDDSVFVVTANASGQVLIFKNYYEECVSYSLAPDTIDASTSRFKISRNSASDFISPDEISVDALNFILRTGTSTQPIVTINIKAHALNEAQFKSYMTIQTSISSRYYK